MSQTAFVTVVSGLPRSGTSVMMQMVHAGGIPALIDQIRAADEDNPRGYFEFERVKKIKTDQEWVSHAQGKVVKIVHLLLYELPRQYSYRIIFMRRKLEEVIASQQVMLERQGQTAPGISEDQLTRVFQDQVTKVLKWLSDQPHVAVIEVDHHRLVTEAHDVAEQVNEFLGGHLNVEAMAAEVDPRLYRNRAATP